MKTLISIACLGLATAAFAERETSTVRKVTPTSEVPVFKLFDEKKGTVTTYKLSKTKASDLQAELKRIDGLSESKKEAELLKLADKAKAEDREPVVEALVKPENKVARETSGKGPDTAWCGWRRGGFWGRGWGWGGGWRGGWGGWGGCGYGYGGGYGYYGAGYGYGGYGYGGGCWNGGYNGCFGGGVWGGWGW